MSWQKEVAEMATSDERDAINNQLTKGIDKMNDYQKEMKEIMTSGKWEYVRTEGSIIVLDSGKYCCFIHTNKTQIFNH